nr:hypothetical protein [Tanacetum cinerariifolium]
MPPRMRTRSAGRPTAGSLGRGTGVRIGRGGRGRRPTEVFIDDILIYSKAREENVEHLRHMINGNVIHVDPSKIEAVKNWKALRTPFEELTFKTLKDTLCNAPVLALSNGLEGFVVYCDVFGIRLGSVLMQRESVARQLCVGEDQLIGHELVEKTSQKISQIKDRLKAARNRQKSYADKRSKPL